MRLPRQKFISLILCQLLSFLHALLFVFSWSMALLKKDIGLVVVTKIMQSPSVLKPGARSSGWGRRRGWHLCAWGIAVVCRETGETCHSVELSKHIFQDDFTLSFSICSLSLLLSLLFFHYWLHRGLRIEGDLHSSFFLYRQRLHAFLPPFATAFQ